MNFSYWRGSEYNPGDKYTVMEDHTFTAVYAAVPSDEIKEDKTPTKPETPTKKPESKNTPTVNTKSGGETKVIVVPSQNTGYVPRPRYIPNTSDNSNMPLWMVLLVMSLTVAGGVTYFLKKY